MSTDDARINDRIRAREVFLVDSDGTQLGVRTLPEALAVAREQELDLVEVAANANPPVCRIMNHGRYKYEQEQRRKESRKKTTNVVIKEMKFRPKIDGHDYVTKMKHVERFLGEGAKVKLTIMFRGREVFHPELGLKILQRVTEDVAEFATVESSPRQDGRNMTMVLNPIRKPVSKSSKSSKSRSSKAKAAKAATPKTEVLAVEAPAAGALTADVLTADVPTADVPTADVPTADVPAPEVHTTEAVAPATDSAGAQ